MKRQLTEESHLVYGSRGIRVHHGGKVWQQAEDMTGGAETTELTSLTISTKQIVNWKKTCYCKTPYFLHQHTSKPTQTASATGD